MLRHPARCAIAAAALALASLAVVTPSIRPASAAGASSLKLSGATTVGVHNTYSQDDYTYLAQALDAGSSLIELDVWDDALSPRG